MVEVTVTFESTLAALAFQISDVPGCVLTRRTSDQTRPAPDTVAVCPPALGPSAATKASRSVPVVDVLKGAVIWGPVPSADTTASMATVAAHPHAGTVTVTETPADGVSTLPLVSVARLFSVTDPIVIGVHAYVHGAVPAADFHVAPPSVDTSTRATWPPPMSLAVPNITSCDPLSNEAPGEGLVMIDAGACVSFTGAPGTRPGWSEPASTPMSDSRFTVACWSATSGVEASRS